MEIKEWKLVITFYTDSHTLHTSFRYKDYDSANVAMTQFKDKIKRSEIGCTNRDIKILEFGDDLVNICAVQAVHFEITEVTR